MERIIYNRKKIELLSHAEVAREHPEWTEAKQKEVACSEKRISDLIQRITIRDLANKLFNNDGSDSADHTFYKNLSKWIVENAPAELILNVNEYIDDKPLTPINFHGISVNDLLSIHNNRKPINFIDAVSAIIYWKEANYCGKDFCKQFLMR